MLVRKEWRRQESAAQREMAPLAAHAAWHMGHWDEMGTFVDALKALEKPATSEVAFLEAVLHVRRDDHAAAKGAASCFIGDWHLWASAARCYLLGSPAVASAMALHKTESPPRPTLCEARAAGCQGGSCCQMSWRPLTHPIHQACMRAQLNHTPLCNPCNDFCMKCNQVVTSGGTCLTRPILPSAACWRCLLCVLLLWGHATAVPCKTGS